MKSFREETQPCEKSPGKSFRERGLLVLQTEEDTAPPQTDTVLPGEAITVPSGGHGPVLQERAMAVSLREPLPGPLAEKNTVLLEEPTTVPLDPDSTAFILRELTTVSKRVEQTWSFSEERAQSLREESAELP